MGRKEAPLHLFFHPFFKPKKVTHVYLQNNKSIFFLTFIFFWVWLNKFLFPTTFFSRIFWGFIPGLDHQARWVF